MFSLDEIKLILKKYYEINMVLVETDYFTLAYDTVEEEWYYTIDEHISTLQLLKAKGYFLELLWALYGREETQKRVKKFTITNFIDNANNMMADKNLIRLYEKFNFMYYSFIS